MEVLVALGALAGLTGVAAGAFGSHALASRLPAERVATFETAVRYQLWHAVAVVAVGLAGPRWKTGLIVAAAGFLLAGIVLFSGSLYVLAATGVRRWGVVTPFGGLAFLVGWALLLLAALTS